MKFGINYEQGEILIVPFPFSDLSSAKQRPVVVLSKTKDNVESDDVVTCGVTSNLKNSMYSVLIDNNDFQSGSIPVKSRVKVDKLFTLNKQIIKKSLGKLNIKCFNKIKREFYSIV